MVNKYLKMNMLIPAGVYVTDHPHRQPISPVEKALDEWLRLLPDDCFTDTPPNMVGPRGPAELAAANNLGNALQGRGPKEVTKKELNESIDAGKEPAEKFILKKDMFIKICGVHFKVISKRPNGVCSIRPIKERV